MIVIKIKPAATPSGTMFTLSTGRPGVPLTAQGLTLIELMIVLALVAVLTGIAVPVFRDLTVTAGFNRASETLAKAFDLARNESIARGQLVSVCALDTGTPTICDVSTTNWAGGWLVFVNPDANWIFNPNQLIRTYPRVNLDINTATDIFLVFNPIGQSTAATFNIVDDGVTLGNVQVGATGEVTIRRL